MQGLKAIARAALGETLWTELKARTGRLGKAAYYDALTLQIIRGVRADGVWIDVGAHEGDILAEMVAHAPEAAFLAFEPLPQYYARLARRFPGVCVHNTALSDRAGEVTFNFVTTHPAYSGFRQREYPSNAEKIEVIRVRTETLDSIALPGTVRFIKIDVEGAELEVLSGARQTMSRDKPVVVFEHGLGAADYYGTRPAQVFALLNDCGLRVSPLSGFLKGRRPFDLQKFEQAFHKGEYYFVAHPWI